jgi:hypothetical protein
MKQIDKLIINPELFGVNSPYEDERQYLVAVLASMPMAIMAVIPMMRMTTTATTMMNVK